MRRITCIVLMVAGMFAIYVLLIGINMFFSSMFVIALALIVACFMTRDPFSLPDPAEQPEQLAELSPEVEA